MSDDMTREERSARLARATPTARRLFVALMPTRKLGEEGLREWLRVVLDVSEDQLEAASEDLVRVGLAVEEQ